MKVEIIQSLPHVRTMVDRDESVATHVCNYCTTFETVSADAINEDVVAEFVAKHKDCVSQGVRYKFENLPVVTEVET